jgi:hypothetical protein
MPDEHQPLLPIDRDLADALARADVFVPIAVAADLSGVPLAQIEDAICFRKIRFDWIRSQWYVDFDQVLLMREGPFQNPDNPP